ncbi:NAD(P)-dependent dehydrogenase, short-chain alcohol dehydrogenase family [Maribacter sedimenticola]|uniref:NAD(P)-dependent dehydrogenase, short-chain alcohol dehydrogenase family n=1 Tax=Maribacter sedimenticola TaxID=228956 RepID=A0ABY1SI67_9FLAO|nr:SDR family oxidoreductase [Maribacter sedimenticola]SNR48625.1 NAD(P)-dependent dehydrogenase, short-chain alcohol dehydrogenase family [Maribacter sedimenticola]
MKNILLIGGSHGIGLAIVNELKDNHQLFIASRTADTIAHKNITHIPFDATKDELDLGQLPEKIDGFVYCPGSINLKPFKMMGVDTIRQDMEINFFAMVNVVKNIIGKMNEDSSMVFFSTIAVGTGMPFHTSVSAAKGAIEGFAKSMAAEYAPKIRVNVIAPSLVDTPLAGRLLNNEKKREAMDDRHPLKRVGTANDIAQSAIYLLSEKSAWVTGQVLGVDGGLSTLNIH